jgi:hypothetical protein
MRGDVFVDVLLQFANATQFLLCKSNLWKLENINNEHI